MLLTQMRYFQAVARLGSFTKAAESLLISQPAISIAMKKLEEGLGTKLFIRDGKIIRLTEDGQRFQGLVNGLLAHADDVVQTMRDAAEGKRRIRLGLTPMLAMVILPRLYQVFREAHPEITLHVVEAPRRTLDQMLRRDQIDAMLVNLSEPLAHEPEYRLHKVMSMRYCFCTAQDHALAERTSITIPEIGDTPIICFGIEYEQPQFIRELFRPHGMEPNLIYHANSVSTIVEMIQYNGFGGFIYQSLDGKWPELRLIPIEPAVEAEPHLFWKKDTYTGEEIRALVHSLDAAVRLRMQEKRS